MHPTPPDQIGQILLLMVRDFQQRLTEDLEHNGIRGIGSRHRDVFLHLGQYGASRSVDLAREAGIRPQSMMTIIDELENLQLIERRPDPSDSRAKLVDFTKSGRMLIKELKKSTETVWRQYANVIDPDDLAHIFDGLQQLLDDRQGHVPHED